MSVALIAAVAVGQAGADAPSAVAASDAATRPAGALLGIGPVVPVPAGERERLGLAPFYAQHCATGGFPIVASARVSPFALREAAFLVDHQLAHRPDVRRAMVEGRIRLTVMAVTEVTTDVPEHSALEPKAYWDRRARGLGATPDAPCVSCGEENLLGLRGDPYATENILIHEFAHAIHETGLNVVDPSFDDRLERAYQAAKSEGLWRGTYAMVNRAEYWAEGTQSWFDCNRSDDGSHGPVDTRAEIKAYDPRLSRLLAEAYGDGAWRYERPERRDAPAHLEGFDRSAAPAFAWPPSASTAPATTPSR